MFFFIIIFLKLSQEGQHLHIRYRNDGAFGKGGHGDSAKAASDLQFIVNNLKIQQQTIILGEKMHPYEMVREYLRDYFDDANCLQHFRYTMRNYFRFWG